MKATLHFNLEDEQDKKAFRRASKADNTYSILWDLSMELRRLRKYCELSEEKSAMLEEISEFFHNQLNEHNVDFDQEWS